MLRGFQPQWSPSLFQRAFSLSRGSCTTPTDIGEAYSSTRRELTSVFRNQGRRQLYAGLSINYMKIDNTYIAHLSLSLKKLAKRKIHIKITWNYYENEKYVQK
ncbi:hypothetical protein NC653_008250 [Populus alba x Populus x berolinensis]|uniref:Uncharacterized protein n=1 Tax=Populus alba x Populus x berolinensis TaxID=444605 RepID=A0AAD6W9R8_9ROSI|nr:hypothetical protein NC653_008250 [Populus alba x Populus x berolinensis]